MTHSGSIGHIAEVVPLALAGGPGGQGMVIVTVTANRASGDIAQGARLVVYERADPIGTIHPLLDHLFVAHARQSLESQKSGMRSYRLEGATGLLVGIQGGDIDVYFEVLARPARLIIVGGGHIALPLAAIASLVDLRVTVIDDRPEFASRDRFPTVERLIVGPYREALDQVDIDGETSVVLVTRGHVHDAACLERVLASEARYIGMIGSKMRIRTVARHAEARGFSPEQIEGIYAPIGIDIGAQTPAEIAVAIVAEMINVRRGGRAPSLALGKALRV